MATTLHILNPNDNLMKKFQETLHAHLLHVDNKLSEEILNLETSIKCAEKELESEAIQLYQMQQDVQHQHTILQQYIQALSKVTFLREKKNNNIENAKEILKQNYSKLKEEKDKKEKLSQKLKNMLEFHSYLSKWEKELNNHLIISKQLSLQDINRNKILINKKQQRDFILYRLKEEIWKIESEIAYFDEQLQIKNKEKEDANKMIIDANTDLETLHTEHKDLHNIWKSVVTNISKRSNIHDQLYFEQKEAHKLYNGLLLEIQTQQFWLRQQGFFVSLSQQRESQLRELNLLEKEIMIIGQKNFKLEYALEMLTKEEANVNKIITSLNQKLSHYKTNWQYGRKIKNSNNKHSG
ncbi:coiled-coil domain-containing protein 40 [Apis mellifera]|uniref:Coiled-coil domain-containing protein 40 n=1 Tax=Apis mellifera TaxID=7460 RepID=A0A7M7MNL4_APIME|nr:coiled-coil domain-containing protein 40 [Apis mellifera]|eukprot:XP_026298731.1 coiled-coil domain-containing protein 40 [Apis mellifera]